jgi:hypothetical protein
MSFSPGTLWEHINGAAEVFLQYGFQKLETCELTGDGVTVAVGIYDMATPINAFGVYRTELPGGAETSAIGGEAFVSPPYQCLLVKDRFYVKVDVYEGELSAATGTAMVKSIVAALPGSSGLPEAILALPDKHKVAGSERFTRETFLGLRELENCVWAEYRKEDGGTYKVFRMLPPTGKDLDAVWKGLAVKWKAVEHGPGPVLATEIPYRGIVGVRRSGDAIFGVSDCESQTELLARLQELSS